MTFILGFTKLVRWCNNLNGETHRTVILQPRHFPFLGRKEGKKNVLKTVRCGSANWTEMAHDGVQWQVFNNMDFFAIWINISCFGGEKKELAKQWLQQYALLQQSSELVFTMQTRWQVSQHTSSRQEIQIDLVLLSFFCTQQLDGLKLAQVCYMCPTTHVALHSLNCHNTHWPLMVIWQSSCPHLW